MRDKDLKAALFARNLAMLAESLAAAEASLDSISARIAQAEVRSIRARIAKAQEGVAAMRRRSGKTPLDEPCP